MDIACWHTKIWILNHYHTDVKSIYEKEKRFLYSVCQFWQLLYQGSRFFYTSPVFAPIPAISQILGLRTEALSVRISQLSSA
jgi:hypothetical protein